jgi:teichuronic acid biosynthesis glycosyltransferase TuaG
VANNHGRISIIMPAYNAAQYINEAIQSVIDQTYTHWELLVINDGSTDQTLQIIEQFDDERILVFTQEKNHGVSAARNLGLKQVKGEFICFLDADDILPPCSLLSRVQIFENPEVNFVDGQVDFIKDTHIVRIYRPSLINKNPQEELILLTGSCFMGLSWMLRNTNNIVPFRTDLSHCEDLVFFIENSQEGLYTYTNDCILHYRQNSVSAMRNLTGLENGYNKTLQILKEKNIHSSLLKQYRTKVRSIMFKSFLKQGQLLNALKTLFNT